MRECLGVQGVNSKLTRSHAAQDPFFPCACVRREHVLHRTAPRISVCVMALKACVVACATVGSSMLRAALRSLSSSTRNGMQAIVVSSLGDSSALQLKADVPVPHAEPGHALVKLEYSGVNYIDTYFRSGLYPTQLPYIPGAPCTHPHPPTASASASATDPPPPPPPSPQVERARASLSVHRQAAASATETVWPVSPPATPPTLSLWRCRVPVASRFQTLCP